LDENFSRLITTFDEVHTSHLRDRVLT